MSYQLTVAGNVAALHDWHTTSHGGPWHTCTNQPCHILQPQFRNLWQTPGATQ